MPATASPTAKVTQPTRSVKRAMIRRSADLPMTARHKSLYFFPERDVTAGDLEEMLHGGSRDRRCDAVSCMLRYAQWEDIWDYVSREEVREIFDELDLPDSLRAAWARMLKIETVV